ncbi:tail fiber assembly protein [Aeromonas sp. s5]|uniref:tail fiber assembly protein n=2 Tax=Aeromonas sp. s5 TaxID=3138487 RepID=UPI0034A25479
MNVQVLSVRAVTAQVNADDVINMEVLFSHLPDFVPFSARKDDAEEHGRALYTRAMFGEFGEITLIPQPLPTSSEMQAMLDVRLQLAATAMAPLEDALALGIISEAEREQLSAWQRYRVALYRLPQSDGWPTEVNWPEAPR